MAEEEMKSGSSDGKRMSEDEIKNRIHYLIDITILSPREAEVFVRQSDETNEEIARKMDVEEGTVESILYGRIPQKLRKAENTFKETRFEYKYSNPHIPEASKVAYALVGCAGPNCEERNSSWPNVQTATTKPDFKDYFTKVCNTHERYGQESNSVELVFCSLECLQEYEDMEKEEQIHRHDGT